MGDALTARHLGLGGWLLWALSACSSDPRPSECTRAAAANSYPPYLEESRACRDTFDAADDPSALCAGLTWGLYPSQSWSGTAWGRVWVDAPDERGGPQKWRVLFAKSGDPATRCDVPVELARFAATEDAPAPGIAWTSGGFVAGWCEGGAVKLARLGEGGAPGPLEATAPCTRATRLIAAGEGVAVVSEGEAGAVVVTITDAAGRPRSQTMHGAGTDVAGGGGTLVLAHADGGRVIVARVGLDGVALGAPSSITPASGEVVAGVRVAAARETLWLAWTLPGGRVELGRTDLQGQPLAASRVLEGVVALGPPALAASDSGLALMWTAAAARARHLCAETVYALRLDAAGSPTGAAVPVGPAWLSQRDLRVDLSQRGFATMLTTSLRRRLPTLSFELCPVPVAFALEDAARVLWRPDPQPGTFMQADQDLPGRPVDAGPDAARDGPMGAIGTWSAMSTSGAPPWREEPGAVWTGTEMLVWGGRTPTSDLASGGRYSAATDQWAPMATNGMPTGRRGHVVAWTGSEMLIWGGTDSRGTSVSGGGRYDPVTDLWSPLPTVGAPPDDALSATWTPLGWFVWSGRNGRGARYEPSANAWRPVSATGAPTTSESATVWTGSEVVVWGGADASGERADGARYDPMLDRWRAMSSVGAPVARARPGAVWSGTEVVVWGGSDSPGGIPDSRALSSGGAYDPAGDRWRALPDAPIAGRARHAIAWTSRGLLVWGGVDGAFTRLRDGGVLTAAGWTQLVPAPRERFDPGAVWTGSALLVWGGSAFNPGVEEGLRLTLP